tara:strand:- start:503 stop:790 length:288 start_codon:yes stop_codon:yes gene_type:complete
MSKDPRLKRYGLTAFNKPKRTPSHPSKSHVVLAKEGDKVKLIRFGQQGADTKPPRKGESDADKAKRKSFKARHAKNIAKGKMSAAFWADKTKWSR